MSEYVLNHEDAALSGMPLLMAVQRCSSLGGSRKCEPATRFQWDAPEARTLADAVVEDIGDYPRRVDLDLGERNNASVPEWPGARRRANLFLTLDLNADGAMDILWRGGRDVDNQSLPPGLYAKFGGRGANAPFHRVLASQVGDFELQGRLRAVDQQYHVTDYNHDGRQDVLFVSDVDGRVNILISRGDHLEHIVEDQGIHPPGAINANVIVADFDGDGRDDIASCVQFDDCTQVWTDRYPGDMTWSCAGEWYFSRREGTSYPPLQPTGLTEWCTMSHAEYAPAVSAKVADIDADGGAEILTPGFDGPLPPGGSMPFATFEEAFPYWLVEYDRDNDTLRREVFDLRQGSMFVTPTDLNGDGLTDFVALHDAPEGAYSGFDFPGGDDSRLVREFHYQRQLGDVSRAGYEDWDGMAFVPDYSGYYSNENNGVQVSPNPSVVLDFDGDGLNDIVVVRQPKVLPRGDQVLEWRQRELHILRNVPSDVEVTGFVPEALGVGQYETHVAGRHTLQTTRLAPADVDGDGTVDVIMFEDRAEWKVALPSASPTREVANYPDFAKLTYVMNPGRKPRMTQVVNGHGFYENVEYATFADSEVYTPAESCGGYPRTCATGGRTLVAAVERFNGDQTNRVEYTYEYGVTDATGRGFVGFENVVEHDLTRRRMTRRTYDVRSRDDATGIYPFAGEPVAIVSVDRADSDNPVDGSVQTIVTNTMQVPELRRTRWGTTWLSPRDVVTRTHATVNPNAHMSERDLLDASLPLVKEVRERFKVDEWGNVLEQRRWGDGTSVLTERHYDHSVNRVGLLDSVSVRNTTEAKDWPWQGQLSVEIEHQAVTEYEYDPTTWLPRLVTRHGLSGELSTAAGWFQRELKRDRWGNLSSVTSRAEIQGEVEERIETLFFHDGAYAPYAHENALGHRTDIFVDNRLGVPFATMDPNGLLYTVDFDGFGHPVARHAPDGSSETWTRTVAPDGLLVVRSEDSLSGWTETHLDALGRGVKYRRQHENGAVVSTSHFDRQGRLSKTTAPHFERGNGEPNGGVFVTQYRYDGLGNLREEDSTASTAVEKSWRYLPGRFEEGSKAAASVTIMSDAVGVVWRTYADARGRIVAVQDPSASTLPGLRGSRADYEYGPRDELLAVNDSVGQQTRIEYDDLGRRVALDDPASGRVTFAYNGFDELEVTTNALGEKTTFTRDILGRVIREDSPYGAQEYVFDVGPGATIGAMTEAHGRDGISHVIELDELGRLKRKTQRNPETGTTLEFAYDYNVRGQVGRVTYPSRGTAPPFVLAYEYNEVGETTSVVEESTGVAAWQRTASDAMGRVLEERVGPVLSNTYQFDETTSRLRSIFTGTYEWRASPVCEGSKLLDGLGLINVGPLRPDLVLKPRPTPLLSGGLKSTKNSPKSTQQKGIATSSTSGTESVSGCPLVRTAARTEKRLDYSYTPRGRIAERNDSLSGVRQKFSYDALGRLSELAENDTTIRGYNYDALGRLTYASDIGWFVPHKTQPYGIAGRSLMLGLTPTGDDRVDYDELGRAVLSFGRRITYEGRNLPSAVAGFGNGVRYQYGPDEARAAAFYTGARPGHVEYFDAYEYRERAGIQEDVFHIFADDREVATFRRNAGGKLTRSFLHHDAQGSVDLVTDEAGDVVGRLAYEPFGPRLARREGSEVAAVIQKTGVTTGYTGHEHDDDFQLINMGGRIYDPFSRRFLTPDPFVQFPFKPQGLNRYAYVLNDPATLTDPSGFNAVETTATSVADQMVDIQVERIREWTFSQGRDADEAATGGDLMVRNGDTWRAEATTASDKARVDAVAPAEAQPTMTAVWRNPAARFYDLNGYSHFARIVEQYGGCTGCHVTHGTNALPSNGDVDFAQLRRSKAQVETVGVVLGAILESGIALPSRRARGTGAFLEGVHGGTGLGKLADKSINVSERGLAILERHLAQFGDVPQNSAMIRRLRTALGEGRAVNGADASFYMHEISEATFMARGEVYEVAHGAALTKYNVSPFSVYHPEVIQEFGSTFNSNWSRFWGL